MTQVYSPLKVAWHTDRIQTLRDGGQIVPVGLQFILSDFCNHDCWWCAYRASAGLSVEQFRGPGKDGQDSHNPLRMMSREKALEILTDASRMGVRSITFTGGGEPTVHPDHMEIFQYALSLDLECSLNTNGNILRKGWEFVLPTMAYVRFSIDAGTAEDYAKVRRVKPSVYRKVLENLEKLSNEVAKQNSECIVGAGHVVDPENWKNLRQGVLNIRETGAKYVRLASMQSTEQEDAYPDDTYELAKQACQEVAAELTCKAFSVVNLFEGTLGVQPSDPFCGFQQFVMYIGGNCKVYRCCYTAYTSLGEIGDLTRQSLKDWFYSQYKQHKIEAFDARSCQVCPLDQKNQVINYMIHTPAHVNFI